MPHLRLIDVEEATGELRRQYDAAIGRAGKVFNIVKAMSLRPRDFAVRLTLRPAEVGLGDVEALRAHGLSDEAIHDAIQVISYFNYVNRVADGVGVEGEPEWA